MFQNYVTIAIRSLKKHRFYTLINVTGLAVGVASCMIIVLYVINEFSYDRHFKDYERIYRVQSEINFGDNHSMMSLTPAPLSEVIRSDFHEIEVAARFWNPGPHIFTRASESFKEDRTISADGEVFDIFNIPFVAGDSKTALTQPFTMVISRRVAEKYFPAQSPLNQVLENRGGLWRITGVMENTPLNTHFNYDIIMSLANIKYALDTRWLRNINFNTYIKLRKGTNPHVLDEKFKQMVNTYIAPQAQSEFGAALDTEKSSASRNNIEFTLIPLLDIHLRSDRLGEIGINSDINYIYLFSAIAAFVLLIAGINFMNLSTARSATRAKEVGIRKVMGSLRSHLIRQFLIESIVLSMISFLVAVTIARLMMPVFNSIALKELSLPFTSWKFWTSILAAALSTGLLAGLYPSLFLSAFTPASVLKGGPMSGTKGNVVRSILVVFQFWISIVLVVGTIAVNRQLSYIQIKKMGFNKDNVIIIHDAFALNDQLQSFKDEVEKDNRIKWGTVTGFIPVAGNSRRTNMYWVEGKPPTEDNMISLQDWAVDYDYVNTMGIKIVQGRDFSHDFPSDSGAVILNQAAVKLFGLQPDPIGKKISTHKSVSLKIDRASTIIGVVEDFHFESIRENIGPVALLIEGDRPSISFRFESKNTNDVVAIIEKQWKKMGAGVPFDYSFLDEDFGQMYASEQRLGKMFTIFAILALIIASLGLFALTAFITEQRTKEIGIRKVLGASVSGIVVLISKEFSKLILISFALAAPVAWYGIDRWLESYAHKTEIGVLVYLVAGLAAFAIAWITMSFQSIRAALANPTKALRNE